MAECLITNLWLTYMNICVFVCIVFGCGFLCLVVGVCAGRVGFTGSGGGVSDPKLRLNPHAVRKSAMSAGNDAP